MRELSSKGILVALLVGFCLSLPWQPFGAEAEEKATQFLAREVPVWRSENGCFSCHNNGDGARALFRSTRGGYELPDALDETISWLKQPSAWKDNKGDPGVSDPKLANIQFAAALAELSPPATARVAASELLLADQHENGSWRIEELNPAGSPATYGTLLATTLAIRSLSTLQSSNAAGAIEKGRGWLADQPISNVPSAAAIILGLPASETRQKRDEAARFLFEAQTSTGGWGPYKLAPAEAYDTALALLALSEFDPRHPAIARGREWLGSHQEEDGSWPPTTRPSGGRSYAQRVSTTAWALMALLATDPK